MAKLGRRILDVAVAQLALQERVVDARASLRARFEDDLDSLRASGVGKRADGRMPRVAGGDRQRAPPRKPCLPRAQRDLGARLRDVTDAALETEAQRIRIVAGRAAREQLIAGHRESPRRFATVRYLMRVASRLHAVEHLVNAAV